MLDIFWVLPGVHFMYTICHFEDREVISPTLQMLCESELKWRSYGCLKTIVQSWAKISQLRNELRNAPLAHECHFVAPHSHVTAAKWPGKMPLGCEIGHSLRNSLQAVNQVANHLQVVKSPPSCEITNSTCKIKVQTCKMDNSTCESPCEIHLCNLRYLPQTRLDFFSRYFV